MHKPPFDRIEVDAIVGTWFVGRVHGGDRSVSDRRV
jgi:hypothetical protein